MKELDHYGNCPQCGESWNEGSIFEIFINMAKEGDEYWSKFTTEEIEAYVEKNYSEPYLFSKLVGIEYPYNSNYYYDGISEWRCPHCKSRFNKWTSELLQNNEVVAPFGRVITE